MKTPTIDLANCSAQWLTEQDDDALEQAIHDCPAWTSAIAAVLDNAFVMRTAMLMPRNDAENDLKSLDDLLGWGGEALSETLAEREIFRARWRALSETVRYRYYAILQNPVKNLQGFKWVQEITDYLSQRHPEAAPLAELLANVRDADGCAIKPANLTRVLNIMEDNLLITRERSGKEKRVRLGENAANLVPDGRADTAPCREVAALAAPQSPLAAADAAHNIYSFSPPPGKTVPPAGILLGAYGR